MKIPQIISNGKVNININDFDELNTDPCVQHRILTMGGSVVYLNTYLDMMAGVLRALDSLTPISFKMANLIVDTIFNMKEVMEEIQKYLDYVYSVAKKYLHNYPKEMEQQLKDNMEVIENGVKNVQSFLEKSARSIGAKDFNREALLLALKNRNLFIMIGGCNDYGN